MSSPLIYGNIYSLLNCRDNWNGGYLDTCGNVRDVSANSPNLYDVSTALTKNRSGLGSGSWQIISATGKKPGQPVLINDKIHLENQHAGGGGYLDTCQPSGHSGHLYGVSTSASKNRADGSGIWTIMTDTTEAGIEVMPPVLEEMIVFLRNEYTNNGGFLITIGSANCPNNRYDVITTSGWDRESMFWKFQLP